MLKKKKKRALSSETFFVVLEQIVARKKKKKRKRKRGRNSSNIDRRKKNRGTVGRTVFAKSVLVPTTNNADFTMIHSFALQLIDPIHLTLSTSGREKTANRVQLNLLLSNKTTKK